MNLRLLRLTVGAGALFAALEASALPSEITVNLKLDNVDYVSGERIRGVVDVVNLSPGYVDADGEDAPDRLFVEVFKASDRSQLDRLNNHPFVAEFELRSNEGQKLETFLGDHYALRETGRFLAKPVLVHDGVRFEGQLRAFDIVPGMRMGSAVQMFSNHYGLKREFVLVYWNRQGCDHLFLTAHDSITARDGSTSEHVWQTVDLGPLMKITKPTVSVKEDGTVIVIHRIDPDNFVRSEFWSVPAGIDCVRREILQDPETAGSARIRELYKESGGVKPADRPWWKFW